MVTDIFIAYSHEDLAYKNELKKFLRPLLREERVSVWDDYDIEAGQDWDAAIKERLYSAEIVLLLVSSDSLASDYFYGKEVAISLERHARGETVVVPVILRPCDWENTPLGGLEAVPEKGRPVVAWPTQDQAWQDTVSRLRRVVERVEQRRADKSARDGALRRYQAAATAAMQLYDHRQWAEARKACADALALFQPGFLPDKADIEKQMADCEQQLRIEKNTRKAPPTRPVQPEAMGGHSAPAFFSGARPLILGIIGGLALLFFVWMAMHTGNRKPGGEKQADYPESVDKSSPSKQADSTTALNKPGAQKLTPLPVQTDVRSPKTPVSDTRSDTRKKADPTQTALDNLEAQYYQKALDAQTIPAMEAFLKRYPAGKHAASARETLKKLQILFRNHLTDAYKLLDSGMQAEAIKQLDQALALDPGNKTLENIRSMAELSSKKQKESVLAALQAMIQRY